MNTALRILLRFSAWLWAGVFAAITAILLWDGCTSPQIKPRYRFVTFVVAAVFAAIGFTPVAMERRLRRMLPGASIPGIIFKTALFLGLSLLLLLGALVAGTLLDAIILRMGEGTPVFG